MREPNQIFLCLVFYHIKDGQTCEYGNCPGCEKAKSSVSIFVKK